MNLSYPDFVDYRNAIGVFADAAAFGRHRFLAFHRRHTRSRSRRQIVERQLLRRSSAFAWSAAADSRRKRARTPGTHPVAVISYRMWQERLGGDPSVVGRSSS